MLRLSAGLPRDEPYLLPSSSSGGGFHASSAAAPPAMPAAAVSSLNLQPKRAAEPTTANTAGPEWAHMAAPELTQEVKRELQLIRMRGALDPKRFYRSSDSKKALPKYFQLGTVVEGALDGRLTKKERKASILEELMSDDKVRGRAKTQFAKVQRAASEGVKRGGKASRQAKGRPKGIGKKG